MDEPQAEGWKGQTLGVRVASTAMSTQPEASEGGATEKATVVSRIVRAEMSQGTKGRGPGALCGLGLHLRRGRGFKE